MEKWKGKVAIVTGASVGIGANLTIALANAGLIVIGAARRAEAIEVRIFFSLNLFSPFFIFCFLLGTEKRFD